MKAMIVQGERFLRSCPAGAYTLPYPFCSAEVKVLLSPHGGVARRLDHAAAARPAEDGPRPCSVGTPAGLHRRVDRTLAERRPSRRVETARVETG